MRCLVTGASGHLGSFLTRLLLSKGHNVAVLVREESNLWRISDILPRLKLVYGDLSKINQIASEVRSIAPEIVFHLAWYGVSAKYHNDPNQINYNLIGSLNLQQLVLESGCTCWIGIGSQSEYGKYDRILREDLQAQPTTAYGVTKLCVGLLSQQFCEMYNSRYIWFRLLATYGPKDDVRHLIPMVILKLLAGKKPSLTRGEQQWDYLYVEDVCQAIYHVAMNSQRKGVFNLASGRSYSVRSLAERLRNLIDPSLPLGFGEVPYPPGQIMHLQGDIDRLKATGWAPKVSLDEGLRMTVEWHRSHQ